MIQPSGKTRIFLYLAVFALGMLLGVASDRYYVNRNFHQFMLRNLAENFEKGNKFPGPKSGRRPDAKQEAKMREEVLLHLTNQLALTSEQRGKIEKTMVAHKKTFDAKMNDFERMMTSLMGELDNDIRNMLTAEQKLKFKSALPPRPFRGHMGPPPDPR